MSHSDINNSNDPKDLRLDYTNQIMYWRDPSTSSIESAFVNGTKTATVLSQLSVSSSSFDILEDQLYYKIYNNIISTTPLTDGKCVHQLFYDSNTCYNNIRLNIFSDSLQKPGKKNLIHVNVANFHFHRTK